MAKRLTDTDKWKKPFIRALPVEYKLFWLYIIDDCDHAGIWQVDMEVALIRLGVKLSLEKAQGFFSSKIVVLDGGTKWFIPDFINFQYGEFNEANKMFKSIMPVIRKYNLIPHISPIYGVKVMVKDKVMVMDTKNMNGEFSNSLMAEKHDFLNNQDWKEQFCMAKHLSMETLTALQKEWLTDVELRGETVDNYKKYFTNYFNKNNPQPKGKGGKTMQV